VYFSDHGRQGFKIYAGGSFGQYTSTVTLKAIPAGTDLGTTTAAVPTTTFSLGADWMFDLAIPRFDYSLVTGKRDDVSNSNYYAVHDYTGSTIGIGFFSYF